MWKSFILLAALATQPSATLFENAQVKVIRALEKPHAKGSFHEHKPNRVMIYLQAGTQRFVYNDGRPQATFEWTPGEAVFSRPEGMHSPEVITNDPFNIIEIELKNTGSAKPLAALQDSHVKVEFENEQVRVLRLDLGAHESATVAPNDHVVVSLTGDAKWETAANPKVENSAAAPVELIVVELK